MIPEVSFFKVSTPFLLEAGGVLTELNIAYHIFGDPQTRPVVWICHALTANSDPTDWWKGLVGNGYFFDPDRYAIVCANIIGSCYGTTGPLSINPQTDKPYYRDFPLVTIRDLVKAHQLLANHLKINSIEVLMGGSLGGQQAVEWAITEPQRIRHLILIATNAFHSPWGIAFNEAQRMAINADHTYQSDIPNGGLAGMAAARAIALISYRSYDGYQLKQTEVTPDKWDNYRSASYQQYQGEKFVKRFNAYSYVALSKTMDSHHVGRNRGAADKALRRISARTLVISIRTDLLFPPAEQRFLAQNINYSSLVEIHSDYGHDGFLLEFASLTDSIAQFLRN
jgi:homoserine O-acetyltransferase